MPYPDTLGQLGLWAIIGSCEMGQKEGGWGFQNRRGPKQAQRCWGIVCMTPGAVSATAPMLLFQMLCGVVRSLSCAGHFDVYLGDLFGEVAGEQADFFLGDF